MLIDFCILHVLKHLHKMGTHEQTGKVGVVLVTSGPGACGIMTAKMDSVPLIILCGQTATVNIGTDKQAGRRNNSKCIPVETHSNASHCS